ncbi:solute carrier family 22 member 16-like [Bombus bifarius]|uniref:Solute carrier family 22 member 16-like n=1 Tax=Bombus bifarius TaxID=103933 RepID=A0A6P8N9N8_9HYME|nr:solute carrier family 22 member 16-like [Bombus bifarius]
MEATYRTDRGQRKIANKDGNLIIPPSLMRLWHPSFLLQLGWVCQYDALPTIAQSIFFIGAIFGGLIFGWVADQYGRIPALLGANLMGFLAGVATAFTGSFWQFTLCRFFVGFAFDNCFTMMYILVLEYVGPKWRSIGYNLSIGYEPR